MSRQIRNLNDYNLDVNGKRILADIGKSEEPFRKDGYLNVLNKYGTSKDSSTAYVYQHDATTSDMELTNLYETNGLFAKIIDRPAEEAVKHGFDLGINDVDVETYLEETLNDLEWEEHATTAIKWTRLYGGAIIVMLIDDGGKLEEPVDWKKVKGIDELRVFERPIVQPDYASMYDYRDSKRFGEPEFYTVNSRFGSFVVHESRCLVFKNGKMPEQTLIEDYRNWGMPEYPRIKNALRETITVHSDSVKMFERSVQSVYSMKNLANLVSTEDGENAVVKRLEVIDLARGLLNTIAIDADGEGYEYKTSQFSGVAEVIDSVCNMLSAITDIPQTILFGRSPAGMNSTGESDLENYYNFIERIQKTMLKKNIVYLLDLIFRAGVRNKDIDGEPNYKLEFNPLWSMSEQEQANVDSIKAATAKTKADTAQVYVTMQALDPTEVRRRLAAEEEFDIEDVITEDDMEEDLLESLFKEDPESESEKEAIETNAEQNDIQPPKKSPKGGLQFDGELEDISNKAISDLEDTNIPNDSETSLKLNSMPPNSVGVLVIRDGKVLTGTRTGKFCTGEICGPGGHIEAGETPFEAAVREMKEEFGLVPMELIPIAQRNGLNKMYGVPVYYLCTKFDGDIEMQSEEMKNPYWMDLGHALAYADEDDNSFFLPFADSFKVLKNRLKDLDEHDGMIIRRDGGPRLR